MIRFSPPSVSHRSAALPPAAVLGVVILVLVLATSGCTKKKSHATLIPDTTPPTVAFVNPHDLTTGVAIDTTFKVTFSEAMRPLTLTTTTFYLKQGASYIAGTVTYSGLTATFTPALNLANSTVYTATVTTGVKDLAGNHMTSNSTWTITTGTFPDTTPPTVLAVDPINHATGVAANKQLTVTFSEAMAPGSITTSTFLLYNGLTPITGTVSYSGKTATFIPATNLADNTLFNAKVTIGATDIATNPLQSEYDWSFTTGAGITRLTPVALGEAGHFAALAGAAISTVPASDISGDIGVSPAAETLITGFSQTDATGYATSPQVTGFIFAADMAAPTPSMLATAKGDLTTAYNDAAGRLPAPTGAFLDPGAGNLAGLTLAPGLYKFTSTATATTSFTLSGTADDVWIFQIAGSLDISNGVHVNLTGGALAKNVFWQVGTSATLGTTTIVNGTILADQSITLATGATLNGRALAFTGTIALDQNTISVPSP